MRGVRLEASAWADLTDIYDFTRRRWNEDQADTYIGDLFDVFRRIASGAVRSKAATVIAPEAFVCRYKSHLIYWRERQDGAVGIVAILHARMDQPVRGRRSFDQAD